MGAQKKHFWRSLRRRPDYYINYIFIFIILFILVVRAP